MKKENGSKYDNDEQTILKRMTGKSNETDVAINGQIFQGLIDSGSNITTMCDKYFNSMIPKPTLRDLSD